jgi:predicted anti-sigma-YlaC factor YlaD
MSRGDLDGMSCEPFIEAISAAIDGEDPQIDSRLVAAHVASCASCAAFQRSAHDVRRRLVVREVADAPDIARRTRTLIALADRAAAWQVPRVLLAVVAIELFVLSGGDLFRADGDGQTVHDARHLAAFTVAYGVLLLVVVARPARARTALPAAAVLALALGITAIADLAAGRIPLLGEAVHLPELLSVVLIWLLAVPAHPRPGRARRDGTTPDDLRAALRAVDREAG